MNLRSAKVESVATYLDLLKDPTTGAEHARDPRAASAKDAAAQAKRLAQVPEVSSTMTLDGFVPADQEEKLRIIHDAAPCWVRRSIRPGKEAGADGRRDGSRTERKRGRLLRRRPRFGRRCDAAVRLSSLFRRLAASRAQRSRCRQAALMPGLTASLDKVRTSLKAEPVSRANSAARDRARLANEGWPRARADRPKGDANDNETLRALRTRRARGGAGGDRRAPYSFKSRPTRS